MGWQELGEQVGQKIDELLRGLGLLPGPAPVPKPIPVYPPAPRRR